MSAGTAATLADPAITSHYVDKSLPHQPRRLSRSERTRREVLIYYSPRNDRIVTLADAVNIALGLQLEFDPAVARFVERPRRIALTTKQQIDLSFWIRGHDGQERYYLAIPAGGTTGSTSGTVSIRNRDVLDAAAHRHGIELQYVTERELLYSSAERGAYWQLLPHVQHHRRLVNRVLVRAGIDAALALTPRSTLRALTQQFAERFTTDQVAAVVGTMIHQGALRIIEPAGFCEDSLLEVNHAA